ncbi:MAG: hypothetical protein NTX64_17265 [Elusimicrobia bacterium]|nr:hypothetical protein [Elusimicrobiota bacterium]
MKSRLAAIAALLVALPLQHASAKTAGARSNAEVKSPTLEVTPDLQEILDRLSTRSKRLHELQNQGNVILWKNDSLETTSQDPAVQSLVKEQNEDLKAYIGALTDQYADTESPLVRGYIRSHGAKLDGLIFQGLAVLKKSNAL